MKASAKGRYGLQFLMALARQPDRRMVPVEGIALAQGLPPKFIRVLLGSLRKAGLVAVQRGQGGGCALARHPSHITALEVLEALEGPFGGGAPRSSGDPGAEAIRELWARSAAAAREILRSTTLADLAERQRALEVDSHDYAI